MLLGGDIIGGVVAFAVLRAARVRDSRAHCWPSGGSPVAGAAVRRQRPPVPGDVVDPATYDKNYEEELKRGVPFLGDAMLARTWSFSALAVIVVVVIAAVVGPKGPTDPPDPTMGGANPRPEWPFLWLFAMLALSPRDVETFIMLVFPVLVIVALLLVPFVSNRGERPPSRRPVAVLSVIVIYTTLGVLTYLGATAPWSPKMHAWTGDPVPVAIVERSTVPRTRRRRAVSIQKLPQLPRPGRHRRTSRARPDDRRHAADARSTDRPDQQRHARRRVDAGLWQTDDAGRDDDPGRFSGQPAPRGTAARRLGDARPVAGQASRHKAIAATPVKRRRAMRHESRARCFSAFLADDPWLVVALCVSACDLSARLAGTAAPRPASLARAATGGVLGADCWRSFLALGSPIEAFADLLLQVHMLQHLLLLMVGAAAHLAGRAAAADAARASQAASHCKSSRPIVRSPLARDVFAALTHPLVAWPVFTAVIWLWHAPRGYELALGDPTGTSSSMPVFWVRPCCSGIRWCVPYPSRPRGRGGSCCRI